MKELRRLGDKAGSFSYAVFIASELKLAYTSFAYSCAIM